MQKKVCFQVIFVKCTDILGWKLIIYLFYVVIFFLFDTGSILVRRRLVASKQSSLDANCVCLTYFLGWIWITLQNTTFASRHVLLLIAIRVFRRYIKEVLCRILAKSSFTQFSTIHRVGQCLWESSLNAGFLGLGIFNIRFPTSSGWR